MRFLADVGVSLSTVKILREEGHDAVHLNDLLKKEIEIIEAMK